MRDLTETHGKLKDKECEKKLAKLQVDHKAEKEKIREQLRVALLRITEHNERLCWLAIQDAAKLLTGSGISRNEIKASVEAKP